MCFLLTSSYSKRLAKYLSKFHDFSKAAFRRHSSLKSCFLSLHDSILHIFIFSFSLDLFLINKLALVVFLRNVFQLFPSFVCSATSVQFLDFFYLIFFPSVHVKLNSKRLYLSFLDISFLSSRLKVLGGLWLKLYLQYRLELTCNQDLRVICTCLCGKLNNSCVYANC